jgi:hypothetical protein
VGRAYVCSEVGAQVSRRTAKITRLPPSDFDFRKRLIGNSVAFFGYARHGHWFVGFSLDPKLNDIRHLRAEQGFYGGIGCFGLAISNRRTERVLRCGERLKHSTESSTLNNSCKPS